MKKLLLLVLIVGSVSSFAQKLNLNHGLQVSVAFPKKLKFVLSYSANLNYPVTINKNLAFTPLIDAKISLLHNHLSSSSIKKFNSFLYFNTALSYGGIISNGERNLESVTPIYTTIFSSSFKNSYTHNVGFASTYVFQRGFKDKSFKYQKIGNLIVKIHDFYLTYYNDGGPVLTTFGDGADRFWTGGIAIGTFIQNGRDLHQIELNFDKYTGYNKDAFEASTLLFVDNVVYKGLDQESYNSGKAGIRYLNHTYGLGGAVNWWDFPNDLQDFLHLKVTNNSYHHKLEKQYMDIEFLKFYSR